MIAPRPHISFSQLSTYMRCSMQYWFRYVKGIIERPKLAPSYGTAGHNALAANNMKKVATGYDMALPELIDKYSDFYDNAMSDIDPADIEDNDLGKLKDQGVRTMQIYHTKHAPKIRPALVEWEFNIDLSDPEYEYPIRIANGRIDLVTAAEEVFDYKWLFSRRPKTQADVDLSVQLSMYDAVYETRFGRLARALGFKSFVPPGKKADTPPEVQTLTRDPRLMSKTGRKSRRARLLHQLHMVEKEIKAGIFRPIDDPKTCAWCGYREMCQFSLVRDDFTAMQIRKAA